MTVELLYMCRSAAEAECLATYLNELNTTHQQFPSDEDRGRSLSRLKTLLLFHASLALLTQDIAWMQRMLADGSLTVNAITDARIYIDLQLLLARYHLFFGHIDEARLAIDRAFTLILSFTDLRPWRFFIAQWLSETVELLQSSGDLLRAYGIHVLSHPFISAFLSHSSLDSIEYKLREVMLLMSVGQFNDARRAAEDARDAIEGLEVTRQKKLGLKMAIALEGAIVCLSNGDTKCAGEFLQLHPFAQKQPAPDLAHFRDLPQLEMPFIALDAIQQVVQGNELPAAWMEKLRAPISAERVPQANQREGLDGLRQFALALALARKEPGQSAEAAVAAAKITLHQANRLLGSGQGVVPLISLFDKIVVALTAGPVFGGTFQGNERVTVAVQMIEVLNRNIRDADSDAYVRLAGADTEEDRRRLHAASRLAARHTEAELRRLRELMTAAAGEQPVSTSGEARLFDFGVRQHLAAYEIERLAIWRKLEAGGRLVPSRLELPTEERVRSVLADDEALIATAFAFGHAYYVCVRANDARVQTATINLEEVLRDIRIVSEALTAQHAPSFELDSEYPAEAAVRLYDVLLRPVEDCSRGARHLVVIPPVEAIGFPMAALLEQTPPRREHGYDLGRAQWVGVGVGLSYASSVRGFLAARQLARHRWADLEFLGVGDPVLSGYTEDGTPRGLAVGRRSVDREGLRVQALLELPETGTELKAVASLFGTGATVLLRDQASEGRVRREALGQYRILDFATHGLIKDDINGLTEAALVLTPQSDTDASNDGLLTASEIADLSLNAEMAVLSACNTARYDLGQFGVEVQGMATAFAIAGVPRVVAALWPVESKLAERIMVRFFSDVRTAQQLNPAEALRLAMSEVVSASAATPYAHPRFWAGFAVFGDGRGIHRDANAPAGTRLVLHRTGHVEPPKEGEVLAVAAIPGSTDLLMTGFADPVNGVLRRTALRLGADGTTRWVFQDRSGAASKILASADSIYLTGYKLESQDYQPLVTRLRLDGSLHWTRELRSEGLRSTLVQIMFLPSGHLLAVTSAYRPQGEGNDERSLILVELTPDGIEIRRGQIDLGTGVLSPYIRTAVVGDRLTVVASELRFVPGRWLFDVYNQPLYCGSRSMSTVYVVDLKSFALKETRAHAGRDIRALMATVDGHVVAVGSLVGECDTAPQSNLMVAKVEEDGGLQVIFSEEESYRSRGLGLFGGPDGTYFVVGQSDRVFDAQRPSPFDPTKAFSLDTARQKDRVELRDGLILQFDSQGRIVDRSVVSGGVSFALTSGAYVDGRVIAAGSFGLEWGWVEYEVR